MDPSLAIGIVGGTLTVGCLFASWNIMRATHRTVNDRRDLRNFLSAQNMFLTYADDIKAVEYNAHYAAYFWFGNPWRLYSVRLLRYLARNEFISPGMYNDAVKHAQARESEMLDRIARARKAVEDARNSNGRGSDLPHQAFRNE